MLQPLGIIEVQLRPPIETSSISHCPWCSKGAYVAERITFVQLKWDRPKKLWIQVSDNPCRNSRENRRSAGKKNSDQTSSCQRDWRLSASWRNNWGHPWNPTHTTALSYWKGALIWPPIMPRDASLPRHILQPGASRVRALHNQESRPKKFYKNDPACCPRYNNNKKDTAVSRQSCVPNGMHP